MAEPTRGMGRGLSAILAPSHELDAERGSELREIPVELIVPNPHQPRQEFDEGAIAALSESLQERGVLQPVLVRPLPGGTYELIAGERRWRAARLAGFDAVPALVRPDDDAASLELALIENMAREDLNPVEEARACAMLVEELGLTREGVGRRVGRSRVAVSNLMRLLDLPVEVLDLIAAGHLTEGHGRALLTASDHETRRSLARSAVQEGWSVRQTEARTREADHPRSRPRRATSHAPTAHPDQIEAAHRLGEALGKALGIEVRVAPRGAGYRVVVDLADPAAAEALAGRLATLEHA